MILDKAIDEVGRLAKVELKKILQEVYEKEPDLVSFDHLGEFVTEDGKKIDLLTRKLNGARAEYSLTRPSFEKLHDFLSKYERFVDYEKYTKEDVAELESNFFLVSGVYGIQRFELIFETTAPYPRKSAIFSKIEKELNFKDTLTISNIIKLSQLEYECYKS